MIVRRRNRIALCGLLAALATALLPSAAMACTDTHLQSKDSVDGSIIAYEDQTGYDGPRKHSISVWNDLGEIKIKADSATTITDLEFVTKDKAPKNHPDWDAQWTPRTGADQIQYFKNNFGDLDSTARNDVAAHELGHALAIHDHYCEDKYYALMLHNVPYGISKPQAHDKKDYKSKWGDSSKSRSSRALGNKVPPPALQGVTPSGPASVAIVGQSLAQLDRVTLRTNRGAFDYFNPGLDALANESGVFVSWSNTEIRISDLTLGGVEAHVIDGFDAGGSLRTSLDFPNFTVQLGDDAPPTASLLGFVELAGSSLQYNVGSTLYFNPAGSGQVRVQISALDASGISGVSFPDLDGAATGWTTGGTDSSGPSPYTWDYTWAPGAAGSGATSALVTDSVGNTATVPFNVTPDSAGPTGGQLSYADGPSSSTVITVNSLPGVDGASGLASWNLQRAQAALANGACSPFGAFGTIGPANPSATYVDAGLSSSNCYRYRLVATDNVGNQTTYLGASTVQVDASSPINGSIAVPDVVTNLSAQAIAFNTGSDPDSGVESWLLQRRTAPYANASCGPFGSYVTVGAVSPTAPYTDTDLANLTCIQYRLVVADKAGNTTTYNSGGTLRVDRTAPAAGNISYADAVTNSTIVAVASNAGGDSGSGIASAQLQRSVAGFAAGTCGAFAAYANIGQSSAPATYSDATLQSANCYRYRLLVTDGAGNVTEYTSAAIVKVDAATPAGGSLVAPNAITNSAATSIGFSVGADSESGVGSWRLERHSASYANGTCGSYGAFATVGGVNPSPPFNDSSLADLTCYQYQLVVSDQAGNTAVYSSSSSLRIDQTPPTATISASGAGAVAVSGTTSDAGSGVAAILVTYDDGAGHSGTICSPAPAASWACTWNTSAVPSGSYTVRVRATDGADNPATATQTVTVAPSSPKGLLDTSFGVNGFAVTDVGTNAVQANDSLLTPVSGRILTVGTRTDADGSHSLVMTQHTSSGQLVTAFGSNGVAAYRYQANTKGEAVTIDSQGRIYVAGGLNQSQFFTARLGVTRFNSDGSLDASYGTNGTATIQDGGNFSAWTHTAGAIAIDDQGRAVVVSTAGNGSANMVVDRFTTAGAADASFGSNGILHLMPSGMMQSDGYALALLPNGQMLVAGDSYAANDITATVYRLDSSGSVDTSYGTNGYFRSLTAGVGSSVRKLTFPSGGGTLMALYASGGTGVGVGKLTAAGALDASYGTSSGATFLPISAETARDIDMLMTDDGITIAVARAGSNNNNPDKIALGAFNPDGTAETDFGSNGVVDTSWPNGKAQPASIVLLPDTRLVVSSTGTLTANNAQRFLLNAYTTS